MPTTNASAVQDQLPALEALADRLLNRHEVGPNSVVVVPVIGAGASLSAGLPLFSELTQRVYGMLLGGDGPNGGLAHVLSAEASALAPEGRSVFELSDFEFMGLVSRFAHGRRVIKKVVSGALKDAINRPLAYELLAHLAKHGFVDHLVSLNFDELLDESLADEIPERLFRITSPDDVPGSDAKSQAGRCYFFKPFGSLARANFKLQPENVARYGDESVWRFMIENIFSSGTQLQTTVLLVIGYAAKEPAFQHFIGELNRNGAREIAIFVVNTDEAVGKRLQQFAGPRCSVRMIRLSSDLALDLLLQLLQIKFGARHRFGAWIPVARHHIISTVPYAHTTEDRADHRFRIEIILQAVKSRGIFTLESIAEVSRIRRYGLHAHTVLARMSADGIIASQTAASRQSATGERFRRDDFVLNHDLGALADVLLGEWLGSHDSGPDGLVREWKAKSDATGTSVTPREVTRKALLEEQFNEIASAPEIEVSHDASPSTPWLFQNPRPIRSVSELTETTAALLDRSYPDSNSRIQLRGVWTTGEWLFHETGWAWADYGRRILTLLEDGRLTMSIMLARSPDLGKTQRFRRGEDIVKRLARFANGCDVRWLHWGDQNRILTIADWTELSGKTHRAGIYMRRRLATPLVAPVHVEDKDCEPLDDVFARYQDKSSPAFAETR